MLQPLLHRFPIFFLLLTASYFWQPLHAQQGEAFFYYAYGTSSSATIEGRLYSAKSQPPSDIKDNSRKNFQRNYQHFFTDELKRYPFQLYLGSTIWTLQTDKEGYFHTRISPPEKIPNGWNALAVQGKDVAGQGKLLLVPPHNTLGIISDLDDTVLISEVTRKRHLLKNTFLKNPLQRQAVPGIAGLYHAVTRQNPEPENTAVFYLSASPRQLHHNIADFLVHNHFPSGILITRKVGVGSDDDSLIDTFTYKTEKIEQILNQLPTVRFILVGDDGEKDPEIYDEIRQHYPDRIEAVWIRHVHPDGNRKHYSDQINLEDVINSPFSHFSQTRSETGTAP